jgi:hypothetical protein
MDNDELCQMIVLVRELDPANYTEEAKALIYKCRSLTVPNNPGPGYYVKPVTIVGDRRRGW